MAWRYHAQRAITNTWLHRDCQLRETNLEWALSGAGALSAKLDAVSAKEMASDGILLYDEWSTIIYAEEDDQIRWGGIISGSVDLGNGEREITATSFAGYPYGRIFRDELRFYQNDAFYLIRLLWNLLQSDEHSDLGVVLSDNMSGVIIGSEDPGSRPVQGPDEPLETYEARVVEWQSAINEPYELAWWNTPDYGQEIENLIQSSGGEFVEHHSWTGTNKNSVEHRINLHYPWAGYRRNDLRFVEGENIIVPPLPERDGSMYANYVIALGAGEDRHTLRHESGTNDRRLRRDLVAPSKDTYSPTTLAKLAEDVLWSAQQISKYDTIEVFDHPNAPIGSWQLGDDILIQTHSGYEKIYDLVRVVGWSMQPDNPDRATINVVKV